MANMDANHKEIKVPWRWRFKAWWEGYDVADMEARLRARGGKASYKELTQKEPEPPAEPVEKVNWDALRIEVSQLIWGDGYCGPGGPENVVAMSKLLALSPKHSAMVIGAGLGGPARVLAQEFGVWINGYESSAKLAAAGMEMSKKAGLEKKAPIYHQDLENIEAFERNFDRALAKEALFTVRRKNNLLKVVHTHLKDDSLFLITDYVIRDMDSLQHPDVQQWLSQEPHDPHPVTSDMMVQSLEKAGFRIRVNEDITEHYLDMIAEAWATADQVVKLLSRQGPEASDSLNAIMREAQFWNRRTKIMRSGELKVCRYLAHKPAVIR
tara:strand:+ start:16591 stop:17565 length:975 start_codon:yes stop_codon:yes gene_type:complete